MVECNTNEALTVLGRTIPQGSRFATLINENDVYFWAGMYSTEIWIERDQKFSPSNFTLDHYLKYWSGKIVWSLEDGLIDEYKKTNFSNIGHAGLSFFLALSLLEAGKEVARANWGDDRSIKMLESLRVFCKDSDKGGVHHAGSADMEIVKYIYLENEQPRVRWSPTQDDILANDWMLISD